MLNICILPEIIHLLKYSLPLVCLGCEGCVLLAGLMFSLLPKLVYERWTSNKTMTFLEI